MSFTGEPYRYLKLRAVVIWVHQSYVFRRIFIGFRLLTHGEFGILFIDTSNTPMVFQQLV